jgi:cold shock CspA family protein
MDKGHIEYMGLVKWFNNKSGYGFITVISEGDYKGKDIFSHHSSIMVKSNLYKYLVQGEYVSFSIQDIKNKEHDMHAINIRGILHNDLMCETRFKNKDTVKIKPGDRARSNNIKNE